jgi:carboxypeptidase Taq
MVQPGSALAQLQGHLHHTRLLGSISSALYYDQNTVMPPAGAPWRGEQLALLAADLHARQSSPAYAELVEAAEAELDSASPPPLRRNLQLLRLELQRQRCLDPALVAQLARAQSRGNAIWQEARSRNDFARFAPALQELIGLRREQASQLAAAEPVPRSPWEILAQPFEPEISKARLEELFTPLKAAIPALLEQAEAAVATPLPDQAPPVPEAAQEALSAALLASWGYDPSRLLHIGARRFPHHHPRGAGPAPGRLPRHRPRMGPFPLRAGSAPQRRPLLPLAARRSHLDGGA